MGNHVLALMPKQIPRTWTCIFPTIVTFGQQQVVNKNQHNIEFMIDTMQNVVVMSSCGLRCGDIGNRKVLSWIYENIGL